MITRKVTLLIINFNGDKDTIECLQSIRKSNFTDYNVVVVDNSPDNKSLERIENWLQDPVAVNTLSEIGSGLNQVNRNFYRIHEQDLQESRFNIDMSSYSTDVFLIKARQNNGFAAGNNVGLRFILDHLDSKFIWLLNNDVVIEEGSIAAVVNYMSENPSVGIAGTKLLEYNHTNRVQTIGGGFNKYTAADTPIARGEMSDKNLLLVSHEVDYPPGASMIVTNRFLKDVGLMYEGYFLYSEEMDWVVEGKAKGWKLGCILDISVWHKGSSSINNSAITKTKICDYFGLRSRLLFTKRHYPYLLPFVYAYSLLFIANRLRRGQFDRLSTLFKIYFNPNLPVKDILSRV